MCIRDSLGTSPTGVNIDIDGFDRDTVASWDIGANEYVPTPVSFTPSAIDASALTVDPTGIQDGFSFSPSAIDASIISTDPADVFGSFVKVATAVDASIITSDPSTIYNGFTAAIDSVELSAVSVDPSSRIDTFYSPDAIDLSGVTVDPDDVLGSFSATPASIIVKAQTNLGRADLFGLWYVDQPYIERAEASGLIYRATISTVSIESVKVNQPTIEVK